VKGIFEPDLLADFPHRERGRPQEKGRALNPQPRQPPAGRHRLERLELPVHPGRAASARTGQIIHRDRKQNPLFTDSTPLLEDFDALRARAEEVSPGSNWASRTEKQVGQAGG